jgi:predicted nucleotidyltransferase
MFTTAGRERILAELTARARADPAITAAAIVGSAARRQTDPWSDIDLALRLVEAARPLRVADRWADYLQSEHDVVDHLDLWSGPALYRVFLLGDSLQIDLSFWPADDFASTGEPFELVFGVANPAPPVQPTDPHPVVGWAWLYALHTRSALVRGRRWQALEMLEGLRRQIIMLACRRLGLPAHQGRGVDDLSAAYQDSLARTLVPSLEVGSLADGFATAVALLLEEAAEVDAVLARRLRGPLTELVASVRSVLRPSASPGPEQ